MALGEQDLSLSGLADDLLRGVALLAQENPPIWDDPDERVSKILPFDMDRYGGGSPFCYQRGECLFWLRLFLAKGVHIWVKVHFLWSRHREVDNISPLESSADKMPNYKRWKSIKEGPPSPGSFYLVVFLDRFEPQYRFTGLARWDGEGWTEPVSGVDLEKILFFEVTHWLNTEIPDFDTEGPSDMKAPKMSSDYLIFFKREGKEYPAVALWDGLWLEHTGGAISWEVTRWFPIDIPELP
ncbi:hypothetical protein ACFLQ0_02655 [Nitrospinota bacterium]